MRLIDGDKLIENAFKNPISFTAFRNLVKRQPTVDAVPVVRCKNCKSFSHGYCRFHDAKFVRPDGYCYWGERKEGDHHES